MELALVVAPASKREYYESQIARYDKEKEAIKKKAEALEAESEKANEDSDHAMHPHHLLAQSMTLIQIAISLSSITVLTRKRWLFAVAGISAVGGLIMWGLALNT